jgi:tetratricopeptide (TPR) repeat protein
LLAFDKGEYIQARESLQNAYEACEKAGAKLFIIWFSEYIIWVDIELGGLEEAKNLLNNLQKSALEVKDGELIADADVLGAMLLRAQKKWKESITLFEKSLQEFDGLNAKRWNVYKYTKWALCEFARLYLERNHEGDREKAGDLLSQALEIFQKMNAKKDIEKTMKLMEGLQPLKIQTSQKTVRAASGVYDEVQSNIIATQRELKVGESLELEIEVKNMRKEGTILLTKIFGVIPEGFAVARKLPSYRVEGDCLNLKEKQLEPSKKEEVKLVLTPKIQGTFNLKPTIVYLDENGREKTCEPEPVSVTVKELGLKGWLKGER